MEHVKYHIPKNVRTVLEMVDKTKALEWLETTQDNRTVSLDRVMALKQAILRDQWKVTHQGICIGRDGKLYDGQHRLWAIVEADTPVPLNVTYGVEPDAREAMDKGRPRNISDELRMFRGLKNTTHLVSLVANCTRLYAGHNVMLPTLEAFDDWYSCFKEGVDWATQAFASVRGPMGRTPVCGSLAFAYKKDPEKIAEFGLQIRDGVNLEKGSPALTFRSSMMESQHVKRFGAINPWEINRKTLRAAQHFIEGTTIHKLQDSEQGLTYFKKAYADSRKLKQLLNPLVLPEETKRLSSEDSAEKAASLLAVSK